ncbi:methyl-accepting chemotaxis protein [Massilia aurea]|uniref:Methyl-accepting chemotaxis protein n=1 Tax=Massilia aurea TaxID=373040 RepID=A0A7W9WYX6_9BURK|nr:methyl-accepting chemotaxis protein [Massilia aurea]MBB6133395.1 methyl-accepting chemotaxis protein [Massilia aurea]
MKIGTQLTLGFGLVTALMLLLGAFSLFGLTAIHGATKELHRVNKEHLKPLYIAREALAQTGLAARNAYVFTSDAQARNELDLVDQQKKVYLAALEGMSPAFAGDTQFDKVRAGLLAMASALEKPRKFREAGQMEAFGKFLVEECSPLRRQIVNDIAVLVANAERELADADTSAEHAEAAARNWVIGLTIAAFVLSVVISTAIKRLLLKQLGGEPAYTAQIANLIASGDLATNVEVRAGDSTSLLFSVKTMRDSLASIVGKVRHGTDAIASASSEIAEGSYDLAARTEVQASSLERIASAMEELTTTVQQNANNAQQANTFAQSASSVSQEGGAVMLQVTETMASINASSKRIVDIISVIDGIAFQTNILALNAAVEAARAGEQGRGFAVVASEVRNLAQRSASAAREIKVLIEDSVGKVDTGSELVQRAGSTMQNLMESVQRVTEIMGDISTASAEQSVGLGEVSNAIGEMDGMTQQNTALVEEASAASQELQAQASGLASLVGQFRLANSSGETSRQGRTAPGAAPLRLAAVA